MCSGDRVQDSREGVRSFVVSHCTNVGDGRPGWAISWEKSTAFITLITLRDLFDRSSSSSLKFFSSTDMFIWAFSILKWKLPGINFLSSLFNGI